MASTAVAKFVDAFNAFSSLSDIDTAKKGLIEAVAYMVVANALYQTSKGGMTQATVNLTAGFVIWLNSDAVFKKAFSANVADFSTENRRLKSLLGEFEQIGMDLRELTADERAQLTTQMEQFHDLFQALSQVVKDSSKELQDSSKKLQDSSRDLKASIIASADQKRNKVSETRATMITLMEGVIRNIEAVATQEQLDILQGQLNTLNDQVSAIASIAQRLAIPN